MKRAENGQAVTDCTLLFVVFHAQKSCGILNGKAARESEQFTRIQTEITRERNGNVLHTVLVSLYKFGTSKESRIPSWTTSFILNSLTINS